MRCTISQIYFDKELYMFWTDLLSNIRSLNTVYAAIGICHASYVDCLLNFRNSASHWLLLQECGLTFSLILSETFLILRTEEKCLLVFM